MRPLSFRPDALRMLLLHNKIATLDELKQALGSPVDITVFRKLKPLDYLTSYSHRGRYYTLREIARFDDRGLWSQAEVWFSRCGTLLTTSNASNTVRNVVASTPLPMRSRSPLLSTSSRAVADSCPAASLSTNANRAGAWFGSRFRQT
jgi:hypothetical protein